MIVWGGFDGSNRVNTGGRYNPSTDTWTATSITNAPIARYNHTAIWGVDEMIIWGGSPLRTLATPVEDTIPAPTVGQLQHHQRALCAKCSEVSVDW